jgi:hypothetical protein
VMTLGESIAIIITKKKIDEGMSWHDYTDGQKNTDRARSEGSTPANVN